MKIFFEKWFRKKSSEEIPEVPIEKNPIRSVEKKVDERWQEIPLYIEVSEEEKSLVAVVAASVASSLKNETALSIKNIRKKNPEAQAVSLIAAALAAEINPNSQFVIKKIYQKKGERDA